MTQLVNKYLDSHYKLDLLSGQTFKLADQIDGREVNFWSVIEILMKVFNIMDEEAVEFFDVWADMQTTTIMNNLADLQYKLYEQGIELTAPQY